MAAEHVWQFVTEQDKQIPVEGTKVNPTLHEAQTFAVLHCPHPVTEHWTHKLVVSLNVYPELHVKQTEELIHNWQFKGQTNAVWQTPVDEIPHGLKQKLHWLLLVPQYKQF